MDINRNRNSGVDAFRSTDGVTHGDRSHGLGFALSMATLLAMIFTVAAIGQLVPALNGRAIDAKIPRLELQQDFNILRQSLEEGHAGLYRYTSKKDMDAAFDHVLGMIDHDMSAAEFYSIITVLSDAIKCGHTQIVLPKQTKQGLEEIAKQLPLRVLFISGKAYVVVSSGQAIAASSQLLSINGKPVEDIAKVIMHHLPGDGDIESGKYLALDDKFAWYYYLFVDKTSSFAISYLSPSGHTEKAVLAGLTSKELKTLLNGDDGASGDATPWRYELLSAPHAAKLKIATFAPPDGGIDGQTFSQFLESSFKKVATDKIEDLIIDLRGNDGGEDYGPQLYGYIAEGDFEVFSSVDASANKFPFMGRYSKLAPDFQDKFANQLLASEDGRYTVNKRSEYYVLTMRPSAKSYRNRVRILTDGEVFSTGTVFCSLSKSHKRGIFVGEETGGAYQGFNAGELVVITLPASQLRVVIPLLRFTVATGPLQYPRRGVLPDEPTPTSIKDVLSGGDTDLNYTLKLIEQHRTLAPKSDAK